jgi:hypothetical protein
MGDLRRLKPRGRLCDWVDEAEAPASCLPFWLSHWRPALFESNRPSPSDSQFFHAGSQGECRRPVALTGLPAYPLRLSHPLAPAERHRPPYSPLIFRRTTGTDGQLGTRTRFRIHTSILSGRVTFGHPSPRRLVGCSWVLGPPNFCSALEPRRAGMASGRLITRVVRLPLFSPPFTADVPRTSSPPCHLPDSETLPPKHLDSPKGRGTGAFHVITRAGTIHRTGTCDRSPETGLQHARVAVLQSPPFGLSWSPVLPQTPALPYGSRQCAAHTTCQR